MPRQKEDGANINYFIYREVIRGRDSLEVLKRLQRIYLGKIKMIRIYGETLKSQIAEQ